MSIVKLCTQCGAEFGGDRRFCPHDGTALRAVGDSDPLIGQVIADRYEVRALLGAGGMGRVYLAEHVRMGRPSALKVIAPALAATADAITRFNREAANASRINHPNVAQVYDFGDAPDGTLYLAMEFVDGETLDVLVSRVGPLPLPRAAHITRQIADALFAAHHLEIVHRDLKPENVMVARHLDGSDWVKVVDFGIAKTTQRDGAGSQTVTTAGVSLGTPEYMSPEQLAGERLDNRTDIYSLGLVLFHMLTGDLPYPRVTSRETLVRRLVSPPRTLADVRPDLSFTPALQTVLDRALAPDPADRYTSVADFGRDVERAAGATAAATSQPATVRTAVPTTVRTVIPATVRVDTVDAETTEPRRRGTAWLVAALLLLSGGGALVAAKHERTLASTRVALVSTAAQAPATPAVVTRSDSAVPATQAAPVAPPSASTAHTAAAATRKVAHEASAPAHARARSSAPAHDSVPSRLTTAAAEVRGHLGRAQDALATRDLRRARSEFSTAKAEIAILHDMYPDSPVPGMLERSLRQTVRDAMADCYRGRDENARTQREGCDALSQGQQSRARGARRVYPSGMPR